MIGDANGFGALRARALRRGGKKPIAEPAS
jgi:hypothetical protein